MSTLKAAVGAFVWHEHVSADPAQAERFYRRLLGWETEAFKRGEADYPLISSGGQPHGAYARAMEGAPPPHWLSHVCVANLDETTERARRAGGRVAAGPFEMGEVGRIAVVSDPQGAHLSFYEPASDGPKAEGVFVWDELATTDVDGAQGFYEAVLGWATADMGAEYGGYRIFNRGEQGVAGLMALPDPRIQPRWQPYVAVGDPDATVAAARELGATALLDPIDVPNVGRVAVLRDPQGATFGIIRPQPGT